MRIRNGIVTTLHAYSADSEFTDLLKGRYITNVINNNVIVLDNDMHLHIQIDASHTFIQYITREFIIDMFASDGYAKHLVVSNGVPGKTIDYHTGAIN